MKIVKNYPSDALYFFGHKLNELEFRGGPYIVFHSAAFFAHPCCSIISTAVARPVSFFTSLFISPYF